jgi:CDP-diacylglycerol---glycerol-3-phosphate 3-phosphatidyltransferase
MVSMLQSSIKAPVTRVITPLCRGLLKAGISPNQMSALGGAGSIFSAIFLFGSGHFFAGAIVTTIFVLFDLLDGTMARISNSTSRWGALLDSTLDRISDAAIFGAMTYWLNRNHDRLAPILLSILISSSLISYIKARAEALDIECNGGIAERTERLVVILACAGLHGLGVPYIFAIGTWALLGLTFFTVGERLVIVYKGSR